MRTWLRGGRNGDDFNLYATSGVSGASLILDGEGGSDYVYLGDNAGTVQSINGSVYVSDTGGQANLYAYVTNDPESIPQIFTREAQLATRSFVIEEPFRATAGPAAADPIAAGTHDFVIGSRTRGQREPGSMNFQQIVAGRIAGRILRLADQEAKQKERRRISDLCIDAAPNAFHSPRSSRRSTSFSRYHTSGWT